MKKLTLFLFLFAFFSLAYSQSEANPYESYLGSGTFIIKGKVINKPDNMKTWSLAVTDYLSNQSHEIPVAADGTFNTEIPVTDVQDIYLYLGDAITIFSYPGDVIDVTFDANNRKESLVLKGKNEMRQKELDLCLLIYKEFRQASLDLYSLSYDNKITDTEMLAKANEYYDKKIEVIDTFEKEHGIMPFIDKFRDGTYYETARSASRFPGILDKLHCKYPKGETIMIDMRGRKDTIPNLPYKVMDINTFKTSDIYRSYLEFYLNRTRPSFIYKGMSISDFSPVKDDYYFALSSIKSVPVRDWYITSLLNRAFTYYDFGETTFVYGEFKKICENNDYLKALESRYTRASALQPGNPAPAIELKDENGKTVRLSDFKGKFVYIDFWGVGCGPCIHEFKNSKEQFAEKYKDYDIVYMYICVDSGEKAWKDAIAKYDLKGVNLIAEGWEKHPVCQAYNVQGIPHYMLIGKDGNIAIDKCDRPSSILSSNGRSKFDKVIQGSK